MDGFYIGTADAPAGARCALTLLRSVLREAAAKQDRYFLPLEHDPALTDWDAAMERATFTYGDALVYSISLNDGVVSEHNGGVMSLYRPNGNVVAVTSGRGPSVFTLVAAAGQSPPRPQRN